MNQPAETDNPSPPPSAIPPRVILLDAGLGERLRPLALAWAALGQTLALIGPAKGGTGGLESFSMAMLDLQLAVERAGGICLALETGGSAGELSAVLERVVDALGGIDIVVAPGVARAAGLLATMEGLPRRVRPGWVLTAPAPHGETSATPPHGPRVAWVLDGGGAPEDVALQALNV